MQSSPEILQRLSKLEIFSDFSEPTPENQQLLEKVCHKLDRKSFNKNDVIINEGDEGNTLYILYAGVVQVLRKTPGNEEFAVVNLTKEQNVFFGEVALIDRDKRSASVKALTDCETLVLTEDNFLELCESEPLLGYKVVFRIAKRLAGSLRRSTADILALYQALLDEVEEGV